MTPVFLAILKRNVDAVRLLLEAGSDVNMRCHGHSLLHAAIHLGGFKSTKSICTQLVPMILKFNPDFTLKDDRGETSLHIACSLGLIDEISQILEHVTNIIPQGDEVHQKVVTVTQLLDMKDRLGQRPLHHACIRNHLSVVTLLLKSADMNAASSLGETPLHLACQLEHWDIVKVLKEYGADIYLANKRAMTAMTILTSKGDKVRGDIATLFGLIPSTDTNRQTKSKDKTLIVTHPLCLDHHTCLAPIKRGESTPPPENVIRLQVLVDKEVGSLRSDYIADMSEW